MIIGTTGRSKMPLFLSALALACLLEGLPYLAAPGASRRAAAWLAAQEEGRLRVLGFLLVAAGLLLLGAAKAAGAGR
ncbi:MAG: DUF2065 family protein [Acidobacteria bacterium]|nr:MAG: DUF2065 family protein [Acidobacteriota bacterium]